MFKAMNSHTRVIRAATALFATRGFEGTSTRDVAKRAGVNPITIFRRFKNKQELYLQVLDSRMGTSLTDWLPSALTSSDDPEEAFLAVAERLEEIFDPVFMRLLFYAALEKPELLRKRYRARLVSFYEVLGEHIRQRIDRQILREVEPLLMGPALIGMIACHRVLCELLGGDFPGCNRQGSARAYLDIWLFGTSARGVRARQDRTPRLAQS